MAQNNSENEIIINSSKNIRKKILLMAMEAGSSSAHIGGALSITDILSTLFFGTPYAFILHREMTAIFAPYLNESK